MDTFRVKAGSLVGRAAVIDGPEGHHAVDVVRVRPGDIVRLIDGEGAEAIARVDAAAHSEAALSIVELRSHDRRVSVELTVVQALLKGRALDEVVRRCSELGVAEIVPVLTARTIGKISSDTEKSRLARWEAIALAAVKQSRGVFVPRIAGVSDVTGICGLIGDYDRALVAWEEESETGLRDVLSTPAPSRILLVVGPEGGLAADEVERLVAAGATPVGAGRRVLRADWAAAAVAVMISYELGGLLP
jgi:16S rRNA (uracil1498-N3)-methyltransferase